MREIFAVKQDPGPKRDSNEEWRRLHNTELHSLYRPSNIVKVIESIRLRWAGHVTGMEECRIAFKAGKKPLLGMQA